MNEIIGYALLAMYTLALVYICVFGLLQFDLLLKFRRRKNYDINENNSAGPGSELPFVTIQLPVYNERFVIERLIDSVVAIDYPLDRFEIQVLDDSNDDTETLCRARVEKYRALGYQIEHVRRPERKGYKAGALQYGLEFAKGQLIAIFDADFLPRPDFLRRTVPHFENPRVGVVQTRWEHLNQDYSLITRVQAFQLNVHFTVEQGGRQEGEYMLQFNGTAGVWRRDAIDDAGGWQADTLTEDLDLSYRAQLKGWKIRFLESVGSPAELPAEMNSLKSQQFRWMKGGAETARKLLPEVWHSNLPLRSKIHATAHLTSSTVFLFILITSISSVPLLFYLRPLGINPQYFTVFLLGWLGVGAVYFSGNSRTYWSGIPVWNKISRFSMLFPMFLALSMGLSVHNSLAIIQGFSGRRTAFVRTPKFAVQSVTDRIAKGNYFQKGIPVSTFIEGVLTLYFLAAIAAAIVIHDATFVIFHVLLAIGFGTTCYYSIRHYRQFS